MNGMEDNVIMKELDGVAEEYKGEGNKGSVTMGTANTGK